MPCIMFKAVLNLGKNEQTKIGQDEGDRTANVHLVEDIDTEQSESAMNLDEGENFPPLEVEEILRLFSEFEIGLCLFILNYLTLCR